MFVKICGVCDSDALQAAVAAGADAVGFVFAASPRRLTPEHAARLCAELPGTVLRVAVMRHPSTAEWEHVRDVFAPDWLQTDAEDLPALDLSGCRALPVYQKGTGLDGALPAPLLFEGPASGRGRLADWAEAAALARRTRLILAGGLTPQNVEAAVRAVGPWGVDVSSGVERSPGRKDPDMIVEFIARARAVEAHA